MIFAVTIYAQRPFGNGQLSSFGARAIRGATKEAVREAAARDAQENWPTSEGWAHQIALAEVPIEWMKDELANSKQTESGEGWCGSLIERIRFRY